MMDMPQRIYVRLIFLTALACMIAASAEAGTNLLGRGYVLNNGQWPARVIALAIGSDVDVWVTKAGMVYDHHGMKNDRRSGVVSAATWNNAQPEKASVEVGKAASTTVTFFKGPNVPSNPHAQVATKLVSGFVVKSMYPGVDVEYTIEDGNVRFDILAERAELVLPVKLSLEGATSTASSLEGATSTASYVGFKNLRAFQNGNKVAVSFIEEANTLRFEGDFDPSQPLIIDPTVYGTYLGGPEDDVLAGIHLLATGDVVVVGTTTQIDFPAELGKYAATNAGSGDGFIAVYDAALTILKRYTFIGSSGADSIKAVTVDALDNIYVAGTTLSPTFPITGGTAGQVYKGQIDAFALKIKGDLTSLIFSTFIGGNKDDIALGIAVDGDLSVYVCGATNSTASFPTNAGFKKTFGGLIDGFLTKLSSSGASYAYSTYFGVEGTEQFSSVVIENSGSPILTGFTTSSNFQTFPVPGPFQPASAYDRTISGASDAFVTKFGQDGGTLVYSTYIGGNGDEDGKGIFVDDLGRAYLVGETTSTDLPATAGFMQSRIGGRDVFLFVLSATGREFVGCTYYGGSGDERVRSVWKDKANAAVVGGVTTSSDLQVEGSGTSNQRHGTSDGFIANFAVGALKYADLVGGSSTDEVKGIAVDPNDDVYACGITTSTDFGFPSHAVQRTKAGNVDGFVIKSAKGTITLSAPTGGDLWCLTANQTVAWAAGDMAVTDTYRIDITTDDGVTWTLVVKDITANSYSWKPQPIVAGDYKLRVTSSRGHTTVTETTFRLIPTAAITMQPTPLTVCQGSKAEFKLVATGTELKYKWRKNGTLLPAATTATLTIAAATAADAGTYIGEVVGKCGITVYATPAVLTVVTIPTISTQPSNQTVEVGKPLMLTVTVSIAGSRYQWKKNGADIPNATSREYSIPATVLADSGDYSVTVITDCGTVESAVAKIKITTTASVREVRLPTGVVALVGEMPVSEICKVRIDPTDFSEVVIRIVDIEGATTSVPPVRLMHAGGPFVTELPCGTLASGSYMLDVRVAGFQAYIPFVVSR